MEEIMTASTLVALPTDIDYFTADAAEARTAAELIEQCSNKLAYVGCVDPEDLVDAGRLVAIREWYSQQAHDRPEESGSVAAYKDGDYWIVIDEAEQRLDWHDCDAGGQFHLMEAHMRCTIEVYKS
jgi:hypothetical protein